MRCRGTLSRQIGKGLDAARRIGRDGTQKFAELMSRSRIEAAIGAMRQPRNFTIGVFRHRIIAFLKHECPHAEQPELTGGLAKIVDGLFHGIADKHQSLDPVARVLLPGVT